MAGKKKKKRKESGGFKLNLGFLDDIPSHTKQAVGAVLFVALGVFFVLAPLGYAGVAGEFIHRWLSFLLGSGWVLAPIGCALGVYVLMRPREDEQVSIAKTLGAFVLLFSLLGLITLYESGLGGIIGRAFNWPLITLFGGATSGVILAALALVGVFLTFDMGLSVPSFLKRRERGEDDEDETEYYEEVLPEPEDAGEDTPADDADDETESPAKPREPKIENHGDEPDRIGIRSQKEYAVSSFAGTYDPPPLSLLGKDKGRAAVGDVKANANIIKRTLQNFKIEVEMDEVSIGPSVTRYALKPAEGVRISKIVGLQNNLELALAASPIRIEAPIPGKSLVGIEVPNTQKATIGLAAMLTSAEYTDSPKPLLVALGRDIAGKAHFANIAKMPHALVAGTTGSGKSVTIHAIVMSLLYRNSPEQLRFIMIDPKRVELTMYNSIPHLLTPVITDAKKAILSLKWAAKEMERRYEILQNEKVRDIGSYHENVYRPAKEALEKQQKGKQKDVAEEDENASEMPEPMPYVVIIIDELADLMSAYPRELEAVIVRLAQMSRAVGIHLLLSTQRPSVNVITGLIKANVPTRIALQVASQIDSRTILDGPGAEKLLGQGDMLYLASDIGKPLRLQSSFVSEGEMKKVVDYLAKQSDAQELDAIDFGGDSSGSDDAMFSSMTDDEEEDDLYDEARAAVQSAGKASTSYLQRKLRIGYSRAARLIDILEERGVIGPGDGARPREVYGAGDGHGREEDGSEEADDAARL
jgi:S-DNA-T family DNA segregation ATPase FtsK/SpoIIIE